jgi:hydrogenase nickel incorporation protein HypB
MCGTCGCDDGADVRYTALTGARAEHGHAHGRPHTPDVPDDGPGPVAGRTVVLEERVLGRNDELAAANRAELDARDVLAVNLMSSPGSGKTTLLERTIRELAARWPITVVEGDQETAVDAERIRATGVPVVQVNAGPGCHLDAAMLRRGMAELDPPSSSVLFVENVGNLVCPALFDLGEHARVVVMSVTEGDDKPIKYPHMFRTADLVLINKVDLLPYVEFDADRCAAQLRALNPGARILMVSATQGHGMPGWYAWLHDRRPDASPAI